VTRLRHQPVIQQPETDSGVIPDRAGNHLHCNLMPKKPEKKLNRHPPNSPSPIGVPWLVSQAIFEQSLGSLFAFTYSAAN